MDDLSNHHENVVNRYLMAFIATWICLGSVGIARAADLEKPWDRSLNIGFSVATGNSDTLLLTAGLKGEKLWERDVLQLGIRGAYGHNDGTVSTEILLGNAQHKHLFNDRFYATVVADSLHDSVANIEYRLSIGPGAGYYFIRSDLTRLSAEIGPSVVVEKRDVTHPNQPPPPPPNELRVSSMERTYLGLRVGERFDRKLNDNAKVWQQSELLPQVNDFQNYLLTTEVGVEAALTKAMSLRMVGTHRYDNITPDKSRHYDLMLVSSLAYKF